MLKSLPAFSHYFLSHLTSPRLCSPPPPLLPPPAAPPSAAPSLWMCCWLFGSPLSLENCSQPLSTPEVGSSGFFFSPSSLIHKTEEKRSELIKVFSGFYCEKVGQSRQTLTPLAAGICDSSPGLYDITLQATWHKEDDCSIGSHFCHVRSICWCLCLIHKQRRNIYFFSIQGKTRGRKTSVCSFVAVLCSFFLLGAIRATSKWSPFKWHKMDIKSKKKKNLLLRNLS